MPMAEYEVWWFTKHSGWSLGEILQASPMLKASVMAIDARMNRAARTRAERERKR